MKKNVFIVAVLFALATLGAPLFAQAGGMVPAGDNPLAGSSIVRMASFPKTRTIFAGNSGAKLAESTLGSASPGDAWRARTLPAPPNHFNGAIQNIAANDETLLVVGNNGKMAWSDDGRTFTAVANSAFGTTHIFGAAFGNNRWVAVGWEGKAAVSADKGRTWAAAVLDPNGRNIYAVAFGNNRFVAVGDGGTAAWSADGISWTKVSTPILGGQTARDICFGAGRFIAVGLNGRMAWSTDGASWTTVDSSFGSSHIFAVAYNSHSMYQRFVAAGANGKIAWSTDNGATWKQVSNSPFSDSSNIMGVGIWAGCSIIVFGEQTSGNIAGLDVLKPW